MGGEIAGEPVGGGDEAVETALDIGGAGQRRNEPDGRSRPGLR